MKLTKILIFPLFIQLSFYSISQAANFSWLDDLAVKARIDSSGIKAKIAARFHIGATKVSAVINDVGGHADAYMVLRLAEMSHQPVDTVITHYRDNKDKGWGVLAKRLGIKPGSREFHALKGGHDLNGERRNSNGSWKTKGNGKGNGKSKGSNKGKGRRY